MSRGETSMAMAQSPRSFVLYTVLYVRPRIEGACNVKMENASERQKQNHLRLDLTLI